MGPFFSEKCRHSIFEGIFKVTLKGLRSKIRFPWCWESQPDWAVENAIFALEIYNFVYILANDILAKTREINIVNRVILYGE